ncbi:integrase [Micromonospora sp. WMMC241]|uniref:integrase n=1 Tax=Micromonospora sp. WMMC241 TaxID=3015159 RepID=UPI0022B69910|nr:integrase [Micromonospora sp. WMMC241]MCZ7437764.1 integrase [Micromonospora sp. WMMC241]
MRTRLRRLWIEGRAVSWRAEIRDVMGSTDCHRCVRLRIWGTGKTGQALQVDLLSTTWGTPWTPCTVDGAYPTPADVRAVVGYAVRHGWEPDRRGGTFVLSEREHAAGFRLPGFLLTDRLGGAGGGDPTARVVAAHSTSPGG